MLKQLQRIIMSWVKMVNLKHFKDFTDPAINQALKRQEGTFSFRVRCEEMFSKDKNIPKLLEKVVGKYIFRLDRDNNLDVTFTFSSPGTGTRETTVNIEPLTGSYALCFSLSWSPDAICLHVEDEEKTKHLASDKWKIADYSLLVNNGMIIQLGSKGVIIKNPITIVNGKAVVDSYAIDIWSDTLKAIDILQSAQSKDGVVFEGIVSCQCLTLLCTGFEVYCRKRFIEIIDEGFEPNHQALLEKFISQKYRQDFAQTAEQRGYSIAQELVDKRKIDFGNYQNCKDAYSEGYEIRFSYDLGLEAKSIQTICRFIEYRHGLIHVTPLQDWLNYYEPEKEHVIANKATINEAINSFKSLIEPLHKATLKLKPPL